MPRSNRLSSRQIWKIEDPPDSCGTEMHCGLLIGGQMFSSALQAWMASWSCCRFSGLNDFQSLQSHSVLGTCFRVARIRLRTVFLALHVGNRLQDALPEAVLHGLANLYSPRIVLKPRQPFINRSFYQFYSPLDICGVIWIEPRLMTNVLKLGSSFSHLLELLCVGSPPNFDFGFEQLFLGYREDIGSSVSGGHAYGRDLCRQRFAYRGFH